MLRRTLMSATWLVQMCGSRLGRREASCWEFGVWGGVIGGRSPRGQSSLAWPKSAVAATAAASSSSSSVAAVVAAATAAAAAAVGPAVPAYQQ